MIPAGAAVRRLVGATALALLACTSDRSRPFDPPDPADGDGGLGPPIVRISTPAHGQTFLRSEFSEPNAVEFVLTGSMVPGQRLVLETFFLPYGPVPFFTHMVPIRDARTVIRMDVQGRPFHFDSPGTARAFVQVFDEGGRLVSVDSLSLTLR